FFSGIMQTALGLFGKIAKSRKPTKGVKNNEIQKNNHLPKTLVCPKGAITNKKPIYKKGNISIFFTVCQNKKLPFLLFINHRFLKNFHQSLSEIVNNISVKANIGVSIICLKPIQALLKISSSTFILS
ncbi:MAG: hypothetical protein SNJ77_02850, partial [Cytophagales bacterium]